MRTKENILDSGELPDNYLKRNKFSTTIGLGFLISIPIIVYLFIQADDHGLFLPRTDFIDSIIPKSFIYITDEYELRCFEGIVSLWAILYFIFLGILNMLFWRNDDKKSIRICHAILTIAMTLTFFLTMVEDDIYHAAKIADLIGRQQYESKIAVFYMLFFIWLIVQIIYLLIFTQDKLFKRGSK